MSSTTVMSLPLWLDEALVFLQKRGVGLLAKVLRWQSFWRDESDLEQQRTTSNDSLPAPSTD
jgi:hypothetical protein